jgi:opacity protein-like surface antigen
MKALFGAAAVAALLIATPTVAQDFSNQAYLNLGYTNFALSEVDDQAVGDADFNLGAVSARAGARLTNYFGVEGELGFGVRDQEEGSGLNKVTTKLNYEASAFVVGYLPVSPNAELFARAGVGTTDLEVEFGTGLGGGTVSGSENVLGLGVGGQYFFDGVNGVRADYTRYTGDDDSFDFDAVGVSYVRKF